MFIFNIIVCPRVCTCVYFRVWNPIKRVKTLFGLLPAQRERERARQTTHRHTQLSHLCVWFSVQVCAWWCVSLLVCTCVYPRLEKCYVIFWCTFHTINTVVRVTCDVTQVLLFFFRFVTHVLPFPGNLLQSLKCAIKAHMHIFSQWQIMII